MKIISLLLYTAITGYSNAFISNPQPSSIIVQTNQHVKFTPSQHHHQRTITPLHSQPPTQLQQQELTPSTISELNEVTFLQACLQLSAGYIDILKLFIVAVKSGYESNLHLATLIQLVEECPVNSAGRDLMREELALRREWILVVYSMLRGVFLKEQSVGDEDNSGSEVISSEAQSRVDQVIEFMKQLQTTLKEEELQSGGQQDAKTTITNLTVEQAMEKLPSLSQWIESMESPVEKAFMVNDVRVALLTFKVMEEERVCLEDSQGSRRSGVVGEDVVPRPPIKGT